MSHWKDYRCFHCWSSELRLCWSVLTLLALSLMFQACHASMSGCQDDPMCSFMASEGECENDPEYMLDRCPKACRNPCKCSTVTNDTACDCIIKAKEGYCKKEGSMDDCRTTCTKVLHETCPPLDLPEDPNAHLSTWSTKYLTSVLEVCKTGYLPVDDQNEGKKMCGSSLRWISDITYGVAVECEPVDCGLPPSSVNAFGVAPDTTYGNKADYVCAKNYVLLQGQHTLTCNASGMWDGQPLICKRPDCSQPASVPNASFKVSSLSPGGTVNYTCAPGYSRVKGNVTLTCSLSGVWQGSIIVCEVIDCGTPPSSPNTKLFYKNTTLASTANYSCMEGHTMTIGQSVLTCNTSGTWTPEPPVCSKVNCKQPPTVANTVVIVNGTFYGDTANYMCVEGYVYGDGDKTLICLSSGTWDGVLLSCNIISTTSTVSSSTGTSSTTSVISSSTSTSSNPSTSTTNRNPTNYSTTTNSNKTTTDITTIITISSSIQNRPSSSSHSNIILDAASAWAIGVASFIILVSLIILLIVLNCAATRKRNRNRRTNVQGFRNDVPHSLPNFRFSVNWKPNTVTDGSLVLPPGTASPRLSPAPSNTSFHLKDATDGRSTADPRNITLTSYLTVSSALSPASSSSMSISKSPSSTSLASFSERSSKDQMPNIGI